MNIVYRRYHYAADVLAGFVVSVAAIGTLLACRTRLKDARRIGV